MKSAIGLFSPVDNSAGVAKPPRSPRMAMKTESRRIDSATATAVTTSIAPKTTAAEARCHRACDANNVA